MNKNNRGEFTFRHGACARQWIYLLTRNPLVHGARCFIQIMLQIGVHTWIPTPASSGTLPSQSSYSLASARLCSLSKGGNESEYYCSIGIRQAGAAGATPRNAQKPNVGPKSEQYLNARKLHLSARDKRTGAGWAGKRKAGG